MSWNETSSNLYIPGVASRVVKGYSATSGSAWVSRFTREDFPVFGGPRRTICPAPSLPMWWEWVRGPDFPAGFWRSFERRDLRSAWSFSVPLCFGMTESISSSASIFSAGEEAAL
jgi:hypothetical protein